MRLPSYLSTFVPLLSFRAREFTPNTCTHVRLLGPCFKTGWYKAFWEGPSFARRWALLPTIIAHSRANKEAYLHSCTSTLAIHCFASVSFQQFQVLFHSFFKVLFIFPSRYLFAIGLSSIFSFRWNLPPIRAAFPNNSTLRRHRIVKNIWYRRGYHPPRQAFPDHFTKHLFLPLPSLDHNSEDFRSELFPLHSPLLGESSLISFPPLSYMLKFSGYSYPIGGSTPKSSWLFIGLFVNGMPLLALEHPRDLYCYIPYHVRFSKQLLSQVIRVGAYIAVSQQIIHTSSAWGDDRDDASRYILWYDRENGLVTQTLQWIYFRRSASCVQSFDDSLDMYFALLIAFRCVLHR